MSTTSKDRDTIAKLQAELTAHQANAAKMQAEIEVLRAQIWQGRVKTLPGKLNDNVINKAIKEARVDGKRRVLSDGGNLHLQIFPQRGRGLFVSWLVRWGITLSKGKYTEGSVGLGSLNEVPLTKARELAMQCREWIRQGKNPKVEFALLKHIDKDTFRTVAQLADEYLQKKIKPRSKKYFNRSKQQLDDFVLKHIGAMPVMSVTRRIINNVLTKDNFWDEKRPSAEEVRSHLTRMFHLAMFSGYYPKGENPAEWTGVQENMLSNDEHKAVHHPSLNFRELPEFVPQLRAYRYDRPWPLTGTERPIVSYAIEFLLLYGGRVSELTQAQWKEFDLVEKKWTIPAEHAKGKKSRSVPLTTTMLAILDEMQKLRFDLSDDALVFPSVTMKAQKHTTTQIASQTLQRLTRDFFKIGITNHGWRSTFKDWCNARARKHHPGYQFEWYRMQIDHWEGVSKAEIAYGPDRLLEERRIIMQAYDDYATGTPPAAQADDVVVSLKRRTA